jgi:putative (di)nucleoside polyphosphate hydrolase
MDAWQFPQGGIKRDETPEMAVFRELEEEVGLHPEHVEVLGRTERWLRYRLPKKHIRHWDKPVCIGQKQLWYALRLTASDDDVDLERAARPEFDDWRWIDYWLPVEEVVSFKRNVYKRALTELQTVAGMPSPSS